MKKRYLFYIVCAFIFAFISINYVNAEEKKVYWKISGGSGPNGTDLNKGIKSINLENINNIIKIVFNDTSKTNSFVDYYDSSIDLSRDNDGSVMAYLDYDVLYIQYDGTLQFNSNANTFFYNLEYLEEIEGLEYVDFSQVTYANGMFRSNNRLESIDLSNADFSNATQMYEMFAENSHLKYLNLSNMKVDNVTDIRRLFNNDDKLQDIIMDNIDFSSITNMSSLFSNLESLMNISLINFKTTNVKNMSRMFYNLSKLNSINLSSFDTSKVENMEYMFSNCTSLTELDVSNFDTSKVTNMENMFYNLKIHSLNLSNFNTERVKDMSGMFMNMSQLEELDVSNFNTEKVLDMSYMFQGLSEITSLDLSSFNVIRVEDFNGMFNYNYNLKHIYVSRDWNTNNSYSFIMFEGCYSLLGFNEFNIFDKHDFSDSYDDDYNLISDPYYTIPNDFIYAVIESYDKEGLFTIKHNISSDLYKIDFEGNESSIYIHDNEFSLDNISISNLTTNLEDDKLYIYYGTKLLRIYTIKNYKHIENVFLVNPVELKLYDKSEIDYYIDPEDTDDEHTLVWKSSNTNVVTVDQTGKIYGKNPGKATITATSVNGKYGTATITVPKVTIEDLVVIDNKPQAYTGKQLKPKFTLKYKNYKLKNKTDYTFSYGANKKIGLGYVKYKFKGNYTGTGYVIFFIVSPKTKINKLVSTSKKTISVYYNKSKSAAGYQVGFRINGTSKWYGAHSKKLGKKIKNLKSKKTYQIKVRPYNNINGKKVYGPWSSTKKIKVK